MSVNRWWITAGVIAAVVGEVSGFGVSEPPARAIARKPKMTTLHFFSWMRYEVLQDHSGYGLKINDHTPLRAGERYMFISKNYTGNHRHHARKASGSDRVDCAIVKAHQVICSFRI